MNADQKLRHMIGDLMVQIAVLSAQNEELLKENTELKKQEPQPE